MLRDHGDDAVALDQLGGRGRRLLRVELVVLDDQLDGTAVDATVGVDAIEVGRGQVADVGEVDAGDRRHDGAGHDRLAGRLLTGAETTDALAVGVALEGGIDVAGRRLCVAGRFGVGRRLRVAAGASVSAGGASVSAGGASVSSDGASVSGAASSSSPPQAATSSAAAAPSAINRRNFMWSPLCRSVIVEVRIGTCGDARTTSRAAPYASERGPHCVVRLFFGSLDRPPVERRRKVVRRAILEQTIVPQMRTPGGAGRRPDRPRWRRTRRLPLERMDDR